MPTMLVTVKIAAKSFEKLPEASICASLSEKNDLNKSVAVCDARVIFG